MSLLLDQSRIYRAGIDEHYYQSNLLYDLIHDWSFVARAAGQQVFDDIKLCFASEKIEEQRFYAYFAGANARKAFSIAARILALDKERQRYLHNRPIDWNRL